MGRALSVLSLCFLVNVLFFISDTSVAADPLISTFMNVDATNGTMGANTTTTGLIDTTSPEVTAGLILTSVPFIGVVWDGIKLFFNFLLAPIIVMTKTGMPFELRLFFGGFFYLLYIGSILAVVFRWDI